MFRQMKCNCLIVLSTFTWANIFMATAISNQKFRGICLQHLELIHLLGKLLFGNSGGQNDDQADL